MGTAEPNIAETTLDAFLGGKVEVEQSKTGPRAGTDSVLLAASIPAIEGDAVLEAGIGAGVVSLCLAGRVGKLDITGVELQPELAGLAAANAQRNNLGSCFKVTQGDVTGSGNRWKAMGLVPDSFDHSFANPPFYDRCNSRKPKDPVKAQAHSHDGGALERWVRFLISHTKPKGTITFVHTPDMLGTLLALFERRVGSLRIYPIFSKEGQPASRILIQGIKSSKGPLQICPGLIMHDEDGAFTPKAVSILRDGFALKIE